LQQCPFILADKGYQGIYTLYPNSLLPSKAKRRCKLDPELKIYNQEIKKEESGLSMYLVVSRPLKSLPNVIEIEVKD